MKIDLHLHSKYSWDSTVPIESYIREAEKQGFGAIAITDHNNIDSHVEIEKLQADTKVILIPGQEVTTKDGHLLVLGWIKQVPQNLTMKESVEFAKSENKDAVCIAAHPFDRLRSGKGAKIQDAAIDGLEILNASALFGIFNWQAKRFARNRYNIQLGNSDSHRISEFGFAYTEIPDVESHEEVLRNLQKGIAKGKRIGLRRKSARFLKRKLGIN